MEDIHPRAVRYRGSINPPFSLHLESPHLKPLPGTTWGRYGAGTSALSHEYALQQALDAAQVVRRAAAAVFAEAIASATYDSDSPLQRAAHRLAGFFEMPSQAFREEGANVRTAVLVFDRYRLKIGQFVREQVADLSARRRSAAAFRGERVFEAEARHAVAG
ncbi:hypothetical protein BZM27_53590 [Paraburkholderia steynii]|uniref:Uncharacterized protein n=1 Tax=Paraburkholderia steynii TaxID=1245441 RepID=A0A4R0XA49_9BURK|nr:hypothetical protein BZM27_53590 [Paraburkholderia steynii]